MSEQPPTAPAMTLSWPFVVTLAIVLAATIAAPRFGASPGDVLAAIGAVAGGGALVYGRQAAKQTNGVLDGRIEAGTERALARLLPDYVDTAVQRGIAVALDEQPPAASARYPDTRAGSSYDPL